MYVVRMCYCVHQYIIKIDKTGYDHVYNFLLLAKIYYRSYYAINFALVCVHVCHCLIKYYSLVMHIATNSYITCFLSIFILLYRYRFTYVSCFHVWPHIRSKQISSWITYAYTYVEHCNSGGFIVFTDGY